MSIQKWAVRMCALAFVSGLYLTATADEKDKDNTAMAVATTTCALLGGIGMGISSWHFIMDRGRD